MTAERRKHHFIYKITCSVNDKFYYGMHSTDDLNDGYIGSGVNLWHSIRKHGRKNFSLEILEFLPTRLALKQREKELITEELLRDPQCMNLALGGDGGWEIFNNSPKSILIKSANGKLTGSKNLTQSLKTKWQDDPSRMKEISTLGGLVGGKITRFEAARVAALSEEALQKRRNSFQEIGHQRGAKNSQHGKKWIHSLTEKRSMCVSNPNEYLVTGWIAGRKMKFT